jgi:Lrp/AsnC family leucine-responsive transcriptional regulator
MHSSHILGRIEGPIDEKDWIILRLVQQKARISFAELGRQAGLSPPSAAERLRRLEDAGIIQGYHARISPRSIGLEVMVLIEVKVKKTDYARFHKAVEKLAWILECYHVSGGASFLLRAAAPSVADLELLLGHLGQFGETTTSLVLSTVIERREFRHGGELKSKTNSVVFR